MAKPKNIKPAGHTGEEEVLELEIDGVIVNRISRSKALIEDIINLFYETHGARGKVFLIRPSKMNFQSLIEEHEQQ